MARPWKEVGTADDGGALTPRAMTRLSGIGRSEERLSASMNRQRRGLVRSAGLFAGRTALVAALAGALSLAAAEPDAGVFRAVADGAAPAGVQGASASAEGAADEPWVVRQRLVSVDLDRLAQLRAGSPAVPPSGAQRTAPAEAAGAGSAPSFQLNLFDGSTVTAVIEHSEETFSGGYALFGRLVGDPFGQVTLVVNDGVVAGTVRAASGTFRIRTAGGGLHSVIEIDPGALPPPGEPLPPD